MNSSTNHQLKRQQNLNSNEEQPSGPLTVPKMKKMTTNNELMNELKHRPSLDEMKQNFPNKAQVNNLSQSVQRQIQKAMQRKMTDQTSKMIQVVSSAQNIAFRKGLSKQVDSINQRMAGVQGRLDNHNVHMNELTRQNEAMNVDFKIAGQRLEMNTRTINDRLVPTLNELISSLEKGVAHNVEPISLEIYKTLERVSGQSVHDIVTQAVYKSLRQSQMKANKSAQYAKLYQQTAHKDVQQLHNHMSNLVDKIQQLMQLGNLWVSEVLSVLLITSFTSGFWKLAIGVCGIAGSIAINHLVGVKHHV